MIRSILFICIGNICRSPMAEGLLKHALPDTAVLSAGINAWVGEPADPFSIQLMQEQGIDIGAHRARSLASWMVIDADIILTMDGGQKHFIESQYPESKNKIFRLCEASKDDIPDPYKQGLAAFKHSCNLISEGVDHLVMRLMHRGEHVARHDMATIRDKCQVLPPLSGARLGDRILR